MSRHGQRGLSLAELLIAIAIIGLFASTALPAFQSMRRRMAAGAAARQLQSILKQGRARALARGANAGIRFARVGGEWCYAIYDDGDGDGVRNDDIASGIDKPLFAPRPVLPADRGAAVIGTLPRTVKDPDGDPLTPASSPVQFNRSSICSFSPLGESTPGSVYITDTDQTLWAIRVFGGTARVRLLRWNDARQVWER